MQRIIFDLKEQRHVKLKIRSSDSVPFKISYAKYRLLYNNAVESDGLCTIEDHIIDMFLAPQKAFNYTLEVEYGIADEIYVEKIELEVR